jgi:hypothetical protein
MPLSDLGGVEQLLKRFKAAKTEYELFRSIHQESYDFVAPQRETFRFHSPGQEKNRHVFDSTAVMGLEQFASRIKGSLLPSWKQWAKLVSGTDVPESEKAAIDKDLEEGANEFFNALNHSNFDTEINPALIDMGIGTGAIIIDEGEFNSGDTFRFTNVPLAELYPEKPAAGRIRSAWRQHKMPVNKIKMVWPEAKLPNKLEKQAQGNPSAETEVLNGQLFSQKDGRYYNVIIHEGTKTIMFSQDFASQRFIVFRWSVIPGETFGRGPAMQCLPDIRTLNKMVEFKLQSTALAVGGVWTGINDGIFNPNTVRIAPKTIIPVGSNNSQNPTLAPLALGGDPAKVELDVRELQDKINKAFFANPLGDVTDPVRSATENMIRQQEMLKQAGASFGRIRSELIEVLIEAGIDILKELGRFPDIRLDGTEVTIKHTSPLAKAEDIEDFQNILTWAQSNIGIVGPEVFMGTAKVEDFPKVTGDQLGIPAALIRSDEERKQLGEAAAAAAQQQLGGQVEPGQPTEPV